MQTKIPTHVRINSRLHRVVQPLVKSTFSTKSFSINVRLDIDTDRSDIAPRASLETLMKAFHFFDLFQGF